MSEPFGERSDALGDGASGAYKSAETFHLSLKTRHVRLPTVTVTAATRSEPGLGTSPRPRVALSVAAPWLLTRNNKSTEDATFSICAVSKPAKAKVPGIC